MILRIAASTNGALDNIEYCYAVTRLGRDLVMTADHPRHTPPPCPVILAPAVSGPRERVIITRDLDTCLHL